MDTNTRTIVLWSGVAFLIVSGIVVLFLSFGGSNNNAAEDLNAVYTNAAFTIEAQQQTLQAGVKSATPNTLISPTPSWTPFAQSTLRTQTIAPLSTSALPAGGGGAAGCDKGVYVSDVTIPDGTTVPAGQNFTKTWKVSNIGTCTWTATYQLVYISGDSMGGKATAIGKVVKPGESADVSVILTSSSAPGNLTGTWRLSNDKAQAFGDSLTVVVNSGSTTGTAAATATKTAIGAATATFTSAPASTSTPTNTPVPPTDTPMPTGT